ncbi:MAG: DUF2232 domain-containing protein [Alphaproteobacteria bacterium]|nr:DUF2232 domain-containing protein [Alphaproteobacteria bacterium]
MNTSPNWVLIFLGGLLSATLSFSPALFHPAFILFSYLATLPLFLIGLSLGLYSLYGAALIASVLVFIVEGALAGSEFFVLSALGPIFLVNRALLNRKQKGKVIWYPSTYLLRDLTLASAIITVIALGVYLYFSQGEDAQIFVNNFLKVFDPEGQLKDAKSILYMLFPFLPGFFAFSWSVMMIINGTLAQGLLVRLHYNLRPSPTLGNLDAPDKLTLVLGLTLLLSLFGVGTLSLIGKNFTIIFFFPFFLIGLGIIHNWFHKTSFTTLGLTIFYFCLLFLFWPIFIVIFIGILKPWIQKNNLTS